MHPFLLSLFLAACGVVVLVSSGCGAEASGPARDDPYEPGGLECVPLEPEDCSAHYDVLYECQGLIPSSCPFLTGCAPLVREWPECGGTMYCCEAP